MAVKVIDVSYAQGRMDWDAVAPHIGGAIIQLGYGSDFASQDDAQWSRNVAECRRLGVPFGAYLYSYARTDDIARSEVAHALRLLPPPSELAFPVYLDVEESSLGWFFRRAIEIWVSGLREAGYTAGWYSGRALANQYGLAAAPGETWVAEYGASRCAFSGRLDAWQYTSQEWIGGVGPLDASWFYRDYKASGGDGDDDMKLMDQEVIGPGGNVNAGQALGWSLHYSKDSSQALGRIEEKIAELEKKVEAIDPRYEAPAEFDYDKIVEAMAKKGMLQTAVDYDRLAAALAKAVNDDAAKRMAE
ncbi:GH25 family lysozyme [Berryella intestinalis]|uniref:GH25 family lysozyme n=1 Tax=Berryella intestinalis TaxID=1531429 RepID=UPI00068E7239|nr:GH25 family lysozyme [Berryella intestinalis]